MSNDTVIVDREQLESVIATLQSQVDKLVKENGELQIEVSTAVTKIANLESRNSVLSSEVGRIEATLHTQYNQQISNLTRENSKLSNQIWEAENQSREKETKIFLLEYELENSKKSIEVAKQMNPIVLDSWESRLDEGYRKIEEKIEISSPEIKNMLMDESRPFSKWMKSQYFYNVITFLNEGNTDNIEGEFFWDPNMPLEFSMDFHRQDLWHGLEDIGFSLHNPESLAKDEIMEEFSLLHESIIETVEGMTQIPSNESIIEELNKISGKQHINNAFPYVDWSRANKSKAWYKDVNWSLVDFESLSEHEKDKLDWAKINYKEASTNDSFDTSLIDWSDISVAKENLQAKAYEAVNWDSFDLSSFSEEEKQHIDSTKVDYAKILTNLKTQDNIEFDIDSLNWSFINDLDPYFKKKIYKKVAWDRINFSAADSSAFDWSEVNIKKAMKSNQFTLDDIDIEETKKSKAFKKLKHALKKSSADDLLAAASSETLQSIGYKNIAGWIGNNLIINGDEASGFSLIMKPLNYVRASAIASSMGGTLASIDDAGAVNQLRLIMEDNELISQKINNTMADDRSLVWFDEKDGEGTLREHKALDLQVFDQYGGTADDVITGNSKLWFFIDHGQPASSNNDQSSQDNDFSSDPISGPDTDFIEPNIPDIDFENTIPDIDYTEPTIPDIDYTVVPTIPVIDFENTIPDIDYTEPTIPDIDYTVPTIPVIDIENTITEHYLADIAVSSSYFF